MRYRTTAIGIIIVICLMNPAFSQVDVTGKWLLDHIEEGKQATPKIQFIFWEDGSGIIRADYEGPIAYKVNGYILTMNSAKGQSQFKVTLQDPRLFMRFSESPGDTTVYCYVRQSIRKDEISQYDRSWIGVEVLRVHSRLKHVGVNDQVLRETVEEQLKDDGYRIMAQDEIDLSLYVPLLTLEITRTEVSGNELIEAKARYNHRYKPESGEKWKKVREELIWESSVLGQFKDKTDKPELVHHMIQGLIDEFLKENPSKP